VAAQSLGGLVQANGDLVKLAVADIYPGTLMALGMVSAIYQAKRMGKGQFFDVSMYDGILALLQTNVTGYGFTREIPADDAPPRRTLVPFGLFPARNGRVAIAAPQPNHWEKLCEAMERPDLLTDERSRSNGRRVRNHEFVEAEIGTWTEIRTREEIMKLLGGKVPVGGANNMEDIYRDPHVAAREMIRSYQLPGDNPEVSIAGNPIKFADTPTALYQIPPRLGEHNDEVLAEFGLARGERKATDTREPE
jgi:crotonobetainyl-CoA:carnitine CoA-transferase CaiB-like acyl-CoA transferase